MRAARIAAALTLLGLPPSAHAQVAPEPSFVTAELYGSNLVQAHFSVPENQFVLGGILRFPLLDDFDLGARINVGFVDGGDDYVAIGGDGRYALVSEGFGARGPAFNLTFHGGVGVLTSDAVTLWRLPVGFPAGLTFPLVRGNLEIFTHPRLEFGFRNVGDESDLGLLVDVGGFWQTASVLGLIVAVRFGNGLFEEGNQGVFGLGVSARF